MSKRKYFKYKGYCLKTCDGPVFKIQEVQPCISEDLKYPLKSFDKVCLKTHFIHFQNSFQFFVKNVEAKVALWGYMASTGARSLV